MKLALVSLAAPLAPESPPLGAACVAQAIAAAPALQGRVQAFLFEARQGEGAAAMASRIASTGASAAGFSVYAWNRKVLVAVARELRRAQPGIIAFAGGPEATAGSAGLIAEAGLDFAVVGEGESASVAALFALAEGRSLAGIPGIALPAIAGLSDPAVAGAARAPSEDCELLPSPWLSGLLDPRATEGELPWELARGCPYACAYCYESKGDRKVRRIPLARIESELALFARAAAGAAASAAGSGASLRFPGSRKGPLSVFVLDPTFNADRARARSILDLIRSHGRGIRWKFEVRAELLDRDLAARFAAIDSSLQIGLQSANPRALALVGRSLDRRIFARKTALLGEAGVLFGLDLIYGLPGDSLADVEESLDWALSLQPNHLDLFPLALLPGTALAEKAADLGIEAEASPPYLVRATRELPPADLDAAAALATACDRLYSRGRAVGWFLAALRPLRMRASALLREARPRRPPEPSRASFGSATGATQREKQGAESLGIEAEQLALFERLYREKAQERLLPALRDMIRFHGAWGRALAEGLGSTLSLSYDPEELLGPAGQDLASFARRARFKPTHLRVAPGPDGVEVKVARN